MKKKRNIQNIYRLSPLQEGMLFHAIKDSQSGAYIEQTLYSLKGDLEPALLEKSIDLIIQRYGVLRTVFTYENPDHPLQIVLKERRCKLQVKDLSILDENGQKRILEEIKQKEREQGFDLSKDLLMRYVLFKTGSHSYRLLWTFHHIVMDGWSLGIVLKDLIEVYRTFRQGKTPAGEPGTPYSHYIKWLETRDLQEARRYWQEYLAGYSQPAVLLAPARGRQQTSPAVNYRLEEYNVDLDEESSARVQEIARSSGITVNALFQAAWGILLQNYNYTDDVVFGAVVSGRPYEIPGIDKMVGLFINTVPVRVKTPTGKISILELSEEVHYGNALSKPYEYLQLAEIQSQSPLKGNLLNHLMIFENYPVQDVLKGMDNEGGLGFSQEESEGYEQTNYDFNIAAAPGTCIFIKFSYNSLVYKREVIERIAGHFRQVLDQAAAAPGKPVQEIQVLTPTEKQQLVYEMNRTAGPYSRNKTLPQLFSDQVRQTPDHTALVGPPNPQPGTPLPGENPPQTAHSPYILMAVTYKELDEKAGQLADDLKENGVRPGMVAALMMETTIEMVAGILGILKAGAAYLPLSPGNPAARLKYLLSESNARLLLAPGDQGLFLKKPPLDPAKTLDRFHSHRAGPHDWAYVIYTSGSVGKPKGVVVTHRNVVRLVENSNYLRAGTRDRLLLTGSMGFDITTFEIWYPLLHGMTLYLTAQETIIEAARLGKYLAHHHITILHLIPQLFNRLAEQHLEIFKGIKYFLVGGDLVRPPHIDRLRKAYKDLTILHMYGPTENTTFSTFYPVRQDHTQVIPIGKPIANSTVYIVDRYDRWVPVGAAGELWVGGEGTAAGYLNNPELTAEKFCHRQPGEALFRKTAPPGPPRKNFLLNHTESSPLTTHHSPFYRTGDLARWRADGNIEFLGRLDHQVKINGIRIEPGEIENRLIEYKGIKEAAVAAGTNESGEKYLCAYIVAAGGQLPDIQGIRHYLSQTLPHYMVPQVIQPMETLPLLSSGKVNRRALPEPAGERSAAPYEGPRNEIEARLLEIWTGVLGRDAGQSAPIGINDNFFRLGGDSIKAIQAAARLKKYKLELKINDLFLHPTIKEAAAYVNKTQRVIRQETVTGEVFLTPASKHFFQINPGHHHHFNQAVMLYRREGYTEELLKKVFTKILGHHDALRIVCSYAPGTGWRLENRGLEGTLFELRVIRLQDREPEGLENEIASQATRIQESIDLETGPLVKLGLFKTNEGDHLLMVIHHLVVDGISWRILLEDIETGIRQWEQGQDIQFPEKTDSFKYWTGELNRYAAGAGGAGTGQGGNLQDQRDYWRRIANAPLRPLPTDHIITPPERKYKNNQILNVQLDETQTRELTERVHWAYQTETGDILIAALGAAVKEWAGQEIIGVVLESHGRESIAAEIDVTRTVGWFTAFYPVILEMQRSADLSYTIKSVKETLRRVPNKGIGYGLLKYLSHPGEEQGGSLGQEPQICFNFLGQFGQEMKTTPAPGAETKALEISPQPVGESIGPGLVQPYTLVINSILVAGKLNISFIYNVQEYEKETIAALSRCYMSHLRQLIRHCLEREYREMTPWDVGNREISLEDFSRITALTRENTGPGMEIQWVYPLAPMQGGMLYHHLRHREAEADVYVEQAVFTLQGEVEPALLEQGFNLLIARYETLRTLFLYDGLEEPQQVVLKERRLHLDYRDISTRNREQCDKYIEENRRKAKAKGFDLSRDLLLKPSLFKIRGGLNRLVLSYHHISMDGWCLGIIYNELMQIYRALKAGTAPALPPVTPYRTYIQWLNRQEKAPGLRYWQDYLEGGHQPAVIPGARQAEKNTTHAYEPGEVVLTISTALTAGIRTAAWKNQVTVGIVYQALWGILLQRCNYTRDVVFGIVVSGRPPGIEGIETMVGLFINTIPIRITCRENQPYTHLLKNLREETLRSRSFEYIPLADIQNHSPLKENLIHHIMVYENYPVQEQVESTGIIQELGIRVEEVQLYEQTGYPFNIIIVPGDYFLVKFQYNRRVYSEDTIKAISRHFYNALNQVADDPDLNVDDIEMITAEEKEQVLRDFNRTPPADEGEAAILGLLAAQVERAPDRAALVGPPKSWAGTRANGREARPGNLFVTYAAMKTKILDQARSLKEKGVQPDSIVAIMMERSIDLVVGVLGILQAGGAYLPIDPAYPQERIDYMLADSAVKLLVTTTDLAKEGEKVRRWEGEKVEGEKVGRWEGEKILLEEILKSPKSSSYPLTFLPSYLQNSSKPATSLIYIIYTSGSTGKPKGVMVEQRNLVNLFLYQFRNTNLDCSRVLQFAAICFDASIHEIFSALLSGGTLYVVDKETHDNVPPLFSFIHKNQIKTVFFPISFLKMVFNEEEFTRGFPRCITHIQTAGEQVVITEGLGKYLKENRVYLHNHYGPSETHVVTTLTLAPTGELPELPPIGKPIAGTEVYILAANNHLQVPGAPGQLVIGGTAVGRGYLNNPGLTSEKFLSIFNRAYRSNLSYKSYLPLKIYLTGDLARWLRDGNIEFLGRIDHQVKIRGYRVELGEIESRLLRYPGIKEAVVIPGPGNGGDKGEKRLCAYIVIDRAFTGAGLREYLSGYLPDYMIPSHFVHLEKLPLNPSGKIDRGALPAPGFTGRKNYVPPRNEIEAKLAEIWGKVLENPPGGFGIYDHFFQWGGHSLKATILLSRIQKEFKVQLTLEDLFKTPFIQGQAVKIAAAERKEFSEIRVIEKKEFYPLSYHQKRLWILRQLDPAGISYHIGAIIPIKRRVEAAVLKKTLAAVFARHDSFRTGIKQWGQEPVQFIVPHTGIPLEEIDLSMLPAKEQQQRTAAAASAAAAKPFNLAEPPLFRSVLIKQGKDSFVFVYYMHHIITDGWSAGIVKKEFEFFFKAYLTGNEANAAPVQYQYKDYAAWHNDRIRDPELRAKAHRYWEKIVTAGLPILKFPVYYTGSNEGKRAATYRCTVSEEIKNRLQRLAVANHTTLFMVLFSFYILLLAYLTGEGEIVCGIISAGRQHLFLYDIVGYFINSVIVKIPVDLEEDFDDLLAKTDREVLAALQNQEYPLEAVLDDLRIDNPQVKAGFNLLNMSDSSGQMTMTLPGREPHHLETGHEAKFQLHLVLSEYKDGIEIDWEYQKSVFPPAIIEKLANQYLDFMTEVTGEIDMAGETWNNREPAKET